mgnify:CR=1 FL=1
MKHLVENCQIINSRYIRVPLFVIGICLTGILVSLFRPLDAAVLDSGGVSEKLQYAYKTDQKDRMQLKSYLFGSLKERDDVRLDQVNRIISQEKEISSLDKFHAALIYHHSDNSGDFERASDLATSAAKDPELQDHYQVQWLSKAAYDRWMTSIGKPQKYHTQDKFSIGFE